MASFTSEAASFAGMTALGRRVPIGMTFDETLCARGSRVGWVDGAGPSAARTDTGGVGGAVEQADAADEARRSCR